MASIVFGAGTSHTPMLNAAVEEWPLFEAIDRRRALLHKDGRPATYEELVAAAPPSLQAELAPDKLARRHAGAMAALDRLHEGLVGAKLDALVVVGDDHKELYHDDNMPSILVYRGETIPNVPNRTRTPAHIGAGPPDWMKRAVARYYEESETRHYPVQAEARQPSNRVADRPRLRRRLRQCLARGRRRGPRLRLRPPPPDERRGRSRSSRSSSTPIIRPTSRRPGAATGWARPSARRSRATRKGCASASWRRAGSATSPSTRRSTAR